MISVVSPDSSGSNLTILVRAGALTGNVGRFGIPVDPQRALATRSDLRLAAGVSWRGAIANEVVLAVDSRSAGGRLRRALGIPSRVRKEQGG